MKTIYEGKTKNVLKDEDGSIFLNFKDTMTGTDGVFDTGGNEVAGSVTGAGHECLLVSKFFFEKLNEKNVPSHYLRSDLDKNLMKVKEVLTFGHGLEVITRFVAVGSFIRRYGSYIENGAPLPAYTEITLKDDDRNDPLITKEGLCVLNILSNEEYDEIVRQNVENAKIIRDILSEYGLSLYDIKLEYGRLKENGKIVLIDEVSGGNMRVYKDGKYIEPLELSKYLNLK